MSDLDPIPIIILPADTVRADADRLADSFRAMFPSTPFQLWVGAELRQR